MANEHNGDYILRDKAANYHFAHTVNIEVKPDEYYKHSHTRYELYVFFGGRANFVTEGNKFEIQRGSILLIPPHTYHYAEIEDTKEPYDRLVLNFDRMFVYPELHSFLDSGKNPFMWNGEKHDPLLRDVEQNLSVYRYCDKSLLIQLFLNRLLMDMKYMRQTAAESHTLNSTVSQILEFINMHINEPLSLKTIAENVFLNQSYMSQLFSSYMKIGIMDYVKQKKIFLAEEMIRVENVSPTEAGRRLGFADYSTFYRLYKKYIKELPSAK